MSARHSPPPFNGSITANSSQNLRDSGSSSSSRTGYVVTTTCPDPIMHPLVSTTIPTTTTYLTEWQSWGDAGQSNHLPTTTVSSSHRPVLPHLEMHPQHTELLHPYSMQPPMTPLTPNPMGRSRANTAYDGAPTGAQVEMYLSKHKLKATSRTSALLAGFAMVALVELDYADDTPPPLMIAFAVCTTLLVSVHLLALMMSTCMLPHMEALGGSNPLTSPHHQLRWYIELSWFFSTCLGLILFLVEIGIVFWIKFLHIHYKEAAMVSTVILVPVFVVFLIFTYQFYRKLMAHHVNTLHDKLEHMKNQFDLDNDSHTPLRVV